MTKHSFLDQIKSVAKSKDIGESADNNSKPKNDDQKEKVKKDRQTLSKPSWGALKDDYMLNSKKVSKEKEIIHVDVQFCVVGDRYLIPQPPYLLCTFRIGTKSRQMKRRIQQR
jgi:hypothetical protein